jgi:formate dehydrogenase major subunit
VDTITPAKQAPVSEPTVKFTLDGRELTVSAAETLIEIADREGVEIPRLCYQPGMEAVGNCRACMVEIKGERVLAPACCRAPIEGMQVTTNNERARKAQQMVLELLQSDMPEKDYTRHNEVDEWSIKLKVGKPRFAPRPAVPRDLSHAAIAVNLDACIQCTRCLRACPTSR